MAPTIDSLDTPCLLLDAGALKHNIAALQSVLASAGKRARPHAKTHKCSRIARAQIDAGAVGVSAAKLSEAEALIAAGVEPVLITGPVVTPAKLDRLAGLVVAGHRVELTVDSEEGARLLEAALARRGVSMSVLIDVDPGVGRTGVSLEDAPRLAALVSSLPHLRLTGIQAYAGNLQHIGSFEERREKSLKRMGEAQALYRSLRASGYPLTVLTGGGTGTYDIDPELSDFTDLQAGSYVVMDVQYLAVGSRQDPRGFGRFRPALRVLTTVLSANHEGHVTVDAGLKTLYRDTPAPLVHSPAGQGLGYDWFGDEYGRITVPRGARKPAVGELIELIPSHCDPTINLHDRYVVVEGDRVVDEWPIDLRGKSR